MIENIRHCEERNDGVLKKVNLTFWGFRGNPEPTEQSPRHCERSAAIK